MRRIVALLSSSYSSSRSLLNPKKSQIAGSLHNNIRSPMSWACKNCTFLNPPSQKSECQICLSSPPSPLPPPSASASSSSSSSSSPKWSCKACTLFNSYKNSTCHLCGTRSPVLSLSNLHDLNDTDHDSSVGSVFFPLRPCKRKAIVDDDPSAQPPHAAKLHLTENNDSGNDFGSLKILSYNVWFREDLELHKRMKAIGDLVQLHSPDFICFQEVTPNIYDIFKQFTWWNVYHCSVSSEMAYSRPYFCMLLSKLPVKSFRSKSFSNSIMGRELCIAEVEAASGKSLVVATSHLESPSPAPPKWDQMYSKERVEQAKEALNLLKKHPNVVFGGDMNWDDKLDGQYPLQDGWIDAWSVLRPNEVGWTYDTKSNQMLTGNRTLQKRLDRFVCRFHDLKISSIDMVGMDAIPGVLYNKEKKARKEIKQLVLPVLPSDHYGLLLTISRGYISIGCEPCTRAVLPGQHEREGRWWWEDAKAKECGLHKGNIKQGDSAQLNGNGVAHASGTATVADIFNTQNVVSLSRTGVENLTKLENRKEPWLVVLYAPWCPYCQAVEESYVDLAEKLAGSGVKVGKFRADGEQKEFAKRELELGSFPTIIFFPKHSSRPIKYPSEKRDVDSLMAFVNALR